jgi:hypothetical protein
MHNLCHINQKLGNPKSMTSTTMEMAASRTILWRRRTQSPGRGVCSSHHDEEDEAVINYIKVFLTAASHDIPELSREAVRLMPR